MEFCRCEGDADNAEQYRYEEFEGHVAFLPPGLARSEERSLSHDVKPFHEDEKPDQEEVRLFEDCDEGDLFLPLGKGVGEWHEDDDHEAEEMDGDELPVHPLHAVNHLEGQVPEECEDQECTDVVHDRIEELLHNCVVIRWIRCGGTRNGDVGKGYVPDKQGHREGVDHVGHPIKVDLVDRPLDSHPATPGSRTVTSPVAAAQVKIVATT